MSYQHLSSYALVVCDGCGVRGAVGDHDWRQMRASPGRTPIHLCPQCRRVAIWCEVHQRYHRPSDNHRCACADCGGLFTTSATSGITRCPGCQRAYAQPSVAQAQTVARAPGLFARLRAIMRS